MAPHPATLARALEAGRLLGDGGLGTGLLAADLDLERDLEGHAGCCELLNLRRPELVRAVHAGFLAAGSDAIATNSFCADAASLARRGLAGRSRELALAAARLAREAADGAARDGRARFVLGSMGPGFERPSESGAALEPLERDYRELALALLEGGVDALLVETVRDAAQARAALAGARAALDESASEACLLLSFTPLESGALAAGVSLGEALEDLQPHGLALVALNCLPGAQACASGLEQLAHTWSGHLGAWPNAGLPAVDGTRTLWPLGPQAFADPLAALARRRDLRLVGGCCGTTDAHLRALCAAL